MSRLCYGLYSVVTPKICCWLAFKILIYVRRTEIDLRSHIGSMHPLTLAPDSNGAIGLGPEDYERMETEPGQPY